MNVTTLYGWSFAQWRKAAEYWNLLNPGDPVPVGGLPREHARLMTGEAVTVHEKVQDHWFAKREDEPCGVAIEIARR